MSITIVSASFHRSECDMPRSHITNLHQRVCVCVCVCVFVIWSSAWLTWRYHLPQRSELLTSCLMKEHDKPIKWRRDEEVSWAWFDRAAVLKARVVMWSAGGGADFYVNITSYFSLFYWAAEFWQLFKKSSVLNPGRRPLYILKTLCYSVFVG